MPDPVVAIYEEDPKELDKTISELSAAHSVEDKDRKDLAVDPPLTVPPPLPVKPLYFTRNDFD